MRRILNCDKAVALVTVLIFVLISTLIAGALFALMTNEARLIEHQIRRIRALYAAEAGYHRACWQRQQNPPVAVDDFTLNNPDTNLFVDMTHTPGTGPSGTDIIEAEIDYHTF